MTEAKPDAPAEECPDPKPAETLQLGDDSNSSSTTSKKDTVKEEIFYAFGRDTYFCLWGSGCGWNVWTSSAGIAAYKKLQLESLHAIALTPEGDWIATGKDDNNAPVVAYWDVKTGTVPVDEAKAWVDAHAGYQKLFDQLCKDGDDLDKLRQIRYTVGPRGSWWVKSSTGTYHHNLPTALEAEIGKEKKQGVEPRHIALGRHNSYAVLWSDGTRSWSLTGYDEAHKALGGDVGVDYISLNPTGDEHFMVMANGLISYSITSNRDDVDVPGYLDKQTKAYMQRRVNQSGEEIQYTQWGENYHSRSSPLLSLCAFNVPTLAYTDIEHAPGPEKPHQQIIINPSTNYTYEYPSSSIKITFASTSPIMRYLPTWNRHWHFSTFTTVLATGAAGAAIVSSIPAYRFYNRWRTDTTTPRPSLATSFARRRMFVYLRRFRRGATSTLSAVAYIALGGALNIAWTRSRQSAVETHTQTS